MKTKISILLLCSSLVASSSWALSLEDAVGSILRSGALFALAYASTQGQTQIGGRTMALAAARCALGVVALSSAVVGIDNVLRIVDTTVPDVVNYLVRKSRDVYRVIGLTS